MSKFLLNLLLQISKALVNSKIQFFIQKFFFLTFGPADLAAHSTFGPANPRVDGVFAEVHFPCWFAPSELAASFSSLCQVGPGCQIHLPPLAGRPLPFPLLAATGTELAPQVGAGVAIAG
jgi:hypothetical protein